MNSSNVSNASVPTGEALLIHPPYVFSPLQPFAEDKSPFLPISLLFAGDRLEAMGAANVSYHDCQLQDIAQRDLGGFDSFGVTVMGAQTIAPAYAVFDYLTRYGIDPSKIFFGGQGVEGLQDKEFQRIFPGAVQMKRTVLGTGVDYWETTIANQLRRFSDPDLKIYLRNELALPMSQGCLYACTFCGAETNQTEQFYNTEGNLQPLLDLAKGFGIDELSFYSTSLDFFQSALRGQTGNLSELVDRLAAISEAQALSGIKLNLRALTRTNTYLDAAESDPSIVEMAKNAGFSKFGFGADGAANEMLLRAMRKGPSTSSKLFQCFEHAEEHGLTPEMLYVFGIPEDTEETLGQTRDLCDRLLRDFKHSVYRGYPAKNWLPGNYNWVSDFEWRGSREHELLLSDPPLFANLGFETLANFISHSNPQMRRLVNQIAIEMSLAAHKSGRVQSFLTVPIMETDGTELMDEESFDEFTEIVGMYAPDLVEILTLENLPEHRKALNLAIPKDI